MQYSEQEVYGYYTLCPFSFCLYIYVNMEFIDQGPHTIHLIFDLNKETFHNNARFFFRSIRMNKLYAIFIQSLSTCHMTNIYIIFSH